MPTASSIRASASPCVRPLALTATASVQIKAAVPGDGTTPARRPTFEIVGYTGAIVSVDGFEYPVIVDLTGLKASRDRIPIFLDHNPARIIGQAVATIGRSDVRLAGTITGDDADASKVVTHARNGFEWQASIGATVIRQEFLKTGEQATVNGRTVAGPLLIARQAVLFETSFVAIGADGNTSARVAASNPKSTLKGALAMTFDEWLVSKGFDPATLTDEQRAALMVAYEDGYPASDVMAAGRTKVKAQAPAPAATVQTTTSSTTAHAAVKLEDIFAAARKEEDRIAEITRITAQAVQDRPMLLNELESMSRTAIEAKTGPQEYELNVLRATRAQVGPGTLIRSSGDRKASVKVIEAAVSLAGGLDKPERFFDSQTLNAASDRFPHGIGLRDLLLMSARENGYAGHTSSDVRGLLQAAFAPNPMIRADGFSTNSLSGILGNTANKFLNAGFSAVESTWREIAAVRSVRDFKTVTSYSLTGGMVYEKVGPAGDLKHAEVGQLSYTNKADTYGRMFAITRQDIINDDLGALTEVPRKLGRGAALKLNDVFWAAFMSNLGTFFTSGQANYLSGVTVGTNDSRLNDEGLTRANASFLNQTDPDGLPAAITPRILLVPNALVVPARQLMTSTEVRNTTANTVGVTANVWTGMFKVVASSYLSNTAYSGYSTTAWYLLADPNEMPVIEVAFLNGRDVPIVESADADFGTLGIQMRGYFDFGVGTQEYRGGVMSKGSA